MTASTAAGLQAQWWPAPAKLNLFLHVTGRRADGFHELQTLFQLLDWGDEVYLQATADGDIGRRRADYDVAPDEDLVVRAARQLQAAAGCTTGAVIEVRKRIPIGAGLGGGSSDAATVLLVLNRLWNCGLPVDEIAQLGLELGADVPVFVHGHSAMATGVGEVLEPVKLGERHYLLVMPDIRVCTAEVFSDVRLRRQSSPISVVEALAGGGHNDCEPVARDRHPELSRLMDALGKYGEPRMSGTGATVFLPMPSRDAAEAAARDVERGAASGLKCRYNVRAVGGLDHSPLLGSLGIPPITAIDTGGTSPSG